MTTEIATLFDQLGSLGIDVTDAVKPYLVELYHLALRQVYIVACIDFVVGIPLLIVSFFFGRAAMRYIAKAREASFEDSAVPLAIFFSTGAALSFYFGIILTVEAAMYLLNPHYYAIQHAASVLRGGV